MTSDLEEYKKHVDKQFKKAEQGETIDLTSLMVGAEAGHLGKSRMKAIRKFDKRWLICHENMNTIGDGYTEQIQQDTYARNVELLKNIELFQHIQN